jgi:hypothetical protein
LKSSQFIVRILLLIIAACGFIETTYAREENDSTVVQKFLISYPINDTQLHENYLDNAEALQTIKRAFLNSPRIDSIVIYSYASPEGPYGFNRYLAKERGERARQYLLEQMGRTRNFPNSLIIIKPTAENWGGLEELVRKYYPYSDRNDVLGLLSREDISNDQKKAQLKKLNHGRPWSYIKAKILPKLRYATWVAEWAPMRKVSTGSPTLEEVRSGIKAVTLRNPDIVPIVREPQKPAPTVGRKTILALKTNLLYDILSLTNFSVEIPVYKERLSLLYYHQFPWWTWGQANNEFCTRFLSIGGEARVWFKTKDRLNGHFLGAYCESGKWDFEYQRRICYQGEFYSAGLSYGYARPIGKHLNLEFSISAGYASIAYRGYTPSEDYTILWRDPDKVGRLHYIGPTKAQITLAVPIRIKTRGGNER